MAAQSQCAPSERRQVSMCYHASCPRQWLNKAHVWLQSLTVTYLCGNTFVLLYEKKVLLLHIVNVIQYDRRIRLLNILTTYQDVSWYCEIYWSHFDKKERKWYCVSLTLTMFNLEISCFETRVNPDQLASQKPADLDLHFFPLCLKVQCLKQLESCKLIG